MIVFSEEFAANGVSETLFTLMNNVQIRPDCNVLVAKTNAEYFLKNSKPVLEKLSARYYDIAPTSSEYTGLTESVTLSEFFSDYTDTFTSCYAILGGINTSDTHNKNTDLPSYEKDTSNTANETLIQGKMNIENMGLAVFSKDRFVGELTGMETICHQIVSGKLNTCIVNIPSPSNENQTISVRLQLVKHPKHKVNLVNGSVYIDSNISLEARILSMDENSNYLSEEEVSRLEKAINSYMTSKVYDYLYKISKEYNSDIDGFGSYVVRNFTTYEEWKNFNWLQNFKNSFFNVTVNTTVKSSYIIIES